VGKYRDLKVAPTKEQCRRGRRLYELTIHNYMHSTLPLRVLPPKGDKIITLNHVETSLPGEEKNIKIFLLKDKSLINAKN
jgi:hypothetical protein